MSFNLSNAKSFIHTTAKFSFAVFVVAFASFPFVTYAADLDSFISVSNGGVTVLEGETVSINDVTSISDSWTFNFTWPHSVPNNQNFLAVFRGTFGNLEGGAPSDGVNYSVTSQGWAAGNSNFSKSFNIPSLGDPDTTSGTYTAVLAERVSPTSPTQQEFIDWFASGGTSGVEPANYAFLTFTYDAELTPEELPGALAFIEHESRTITDNDIVYRDELVASAFPNYWDFDFMWPNTVPNLQAAFYVFRGTFGNLEGGDAIENTNYAANLQVWPAGHSNISKPIALSPLSNPITEPGTYTVMVAERHPLSPHTQSEADWFASGGTEGFPPKKYSLLTFEFRGDEPQYAECCSSIVFLPGFKGSILKSEGETLWPADLWGQDIPQLALDDVTGESVNPVVVDGILPSYKVNILGLGEVGPEIYSGFMTYMDALVANAEDDIDVREWAALPYDWRYPPEKILAEGVQTPNGTIHFVEEIERIAASSATGQVSIVAHSMGGLMGKAIIKALEAEDKADLIDSFVMVGSPQLGTPQAIASLLHGDGEGIPGKTLVPNFGATRNVVRAAARNFQSAYNLLPSQEYFADVTDPVFVFGDFPFTEEWRNFWSSLINIYGPYAEFLTGTGVVRERPNPAHIHIPEVLRPELVTTADTFHDTYDDYVFPPGIRVVQVAGWGKETAKGIEYKNQHFVQGYKIRPTIEGDGTVVYPSAISSLQGENYYFDLFTYEAVAGVKSEHVDLLNANPIQEVLTSVIQESDISSVDYISSVKPETESTDDRLEVSAYSPVILGVYDNLGNFTGIYPDQDLSTDLLYVQENIPGSTFNMFGESQHIFLPKEGTYTFVYQGIGAGPTTIEIAEWENDVATPVATYTDISTTLSTSATFMVDSMIPETTEIEVDSDGNGEVDQIISPDGTDPEPSVILTTTLDTVTAGETVTLSWSGENVDYCVATEGPGFSTGGVSAPTDGLVAYWTLDENSGTTVSDASGNGNHGTFNSISNPPTATSGWTTGKNGNAIRFDGSNDRVTFGDLNNATDGVGELTVSAWIYNTALVPETGVVGKYTENQQNWFLSTANSIDCGANDMTFSPDGRNGECTSGNVHQANTWEHWIAVYDGGQSNDDNDIKLYLNGVEQADTRMAGNDPVPNTTASTGSSASIGASADGLAPFSGIIDHVRVYSRALSALEVGTLFNADATGEEPGAASGTDESAPLSADTTFSVHCTGPFGDADSSVSVTVQQPELPNPIVHWTFDEGSGATANDASGNGNTGTLINTPTWTTGQLGGAVRFNGSNERVHGPASFTLPSEFTVGAWVKWENGSETHESIFTVGSNRQFRLSNSSGTVSFSKGSSSASFGQLPKNEWHYVTYTYDGTHMRAYIDGTEMGNPNSISVPSVSGAMAVGAFAAGDDYFKGTVDDFRVYDRALSLSEIQSVMSGN